MKTQKQIEAIQRKKDFKALWSKENRNKKCLKCQFEDECAQHSEAIILSCRFKKKSNVKS